MPTTVTVPGDLLPPDALYVVSGSVGVVPIPRGNGALPARALAERSSVASLQDCEQALHRLADNLAAKDGAGRATGFDRTLSCTIRDLGAVFTGRLHDGLLTGIARADSAQAQIRLDVSSDDLVAMVDGSLNLASAWASGRIKVHAGVRDMMRLRSVF